MKKKIEQLITDLLDDSIAPGEELSQDPFLNATKTVAAKSNDYINYLDTKDVPFIKEIIKNEKNNERKIKAHTLLLRIAKNCNDPEILHYQIEELSKEKSIQIIKVILCGITLSDLTLTKNFNIIRDFAQSRNSLLRQLAIMVMGLFDSKMFPIEDLFINILTTSKDEFDLYYTNINLQKAGTEKCVDSLKNVIRNSKKADVLSTGIAALNAVDGANQVEFFREMLKSKKNEVIKNFLNEIISINGNA